MTDELIAHTCEKFKQTGRTGVSDGQAVGKIYSSKIYFPLVILQ
ncbi:hypothetical protein DET0721 [Dehalococcoides mccartyi 195]|uniref:Uncharacterized protein n=1 Tax=Dehalococcoides mccartyi (strain ATCC BAA-2266 / KCTC 15142 / 195) TaxID=243164 RepID=Q3Z8I9_DEHM1|nr:hypothetical protein DET0721 [Dehalococcoides mccartyi 195]